MASHTSLRSLRTLAARAPISSRVAAATVAAPRCFSSTTRAAEEASEERPRWSYTPEKMKAPFHPRVKDPTKAYVCNEDPAVLDAMYTKLLGRGGESVLSDEVKWLAVTHKSFDQGRRGFNDRLAFLGKRILVLQSNIAVLNGAHEPQSTPDDYGRTPFQHPALANLPKLRSVDLSEALSKGRLGPLAQSYGLDTVTRWKPRYPDRMKTSGMDVVLTQSLLAIIGALALQKGGEVANSVAREKILKPLGIL